MGQRSDRMFQEQYVGADDRNKRNRGENGEMENQQKNRRDLTRLQRWRILQEKLYKMVSVGIIDDLINRSYDIITTVALLINLAVAFANTFTPLHDRYGGVFEVVEAVTVFIFAVDYVLRLLTARCLFPKVSEGRAVLKYIFSFSGIVDLLSFLPYYLPVLFPSGAAVFRLFRVVRILRLFRINAYYDSLNVITEILASKKQQLFSSVFIILVLMMAGSLCMYSLENEAQPEVFENAFSGIWWACSTLLTVGYGDIYPITFWGKTIGMVITFLGVGMVAIPTGIISAGFVEQYTRLKRIDEVKEEADLDFIGVTIDKEDKWCGKQIRDLQLPVGMIIAAIQRGQTTVMPRGDTTLRSGDQVILGAERGKGSHSIDIKEIVLGPEHAWVGRAIKGLNISRQTFVILVKRRGKAMIPRGNFVFMEGDMVVLLTTLDSEE